METQRDGSFLGRWSLVLLLLGLLMPLATTAQTLSYQEAVLRAVDGFNEQSSEPNLYRLLHQDLQPTEDEDPDTPKDVSFTVKETVCPRTSQQPLEQCDFKENGLVKQCVGTVTLDQARGSFDLNCDENTRRPARLGRFFRNIGRRIRDKFRNIRRNLGNFLQNLVPRTES
ncbi:cathelicidin antimicrobial peptide [Carlito syrichta]|uniref:Cathelicidin antimicrobial peptide n=1 Tax=Carlito syrichta TaxID=1868482 RepID=A0A1U7SQI9_CARSF|nr:cathelicidin antimicrobial peptide [Carlito syrichta]